jgi:hypothetical protein
MSKDFIKEIKTQDVQRYSTQTNKRAGSKSIQQNPKQNTWKTEQKQRKIRDKQRKIKDKQQNHTLLS